MQFFSKLSIQGYRGKKNALTKDVAPIQKFLEFLSHLSIMVSVVFPMATISLVILQEEWSFLFVLISYGGIPTPVIGASIKYYISGYLHSCDRFINYISRYAHSCDWFISYALFIALDPHPVMFGRGDNGMCDLLLAGKYPCIVGSGTNLLDFVHVNDVAAGHLAAEGK